MGDATRTAGSAGANTRSVQHPDELPVWPRSAGLRGQRRLPAIAPQRISLLESDFTPTPAFERDLRLFTTLEHRFAGGSTLKVNLGRLEHRFTFVQAGRTARYESGAGTLTEQPNDRTDLDVSWRNPLGKSTVLTTGFALNHSTLDRSTRSLSYWRDADTDTALTGTSTGKSDGAALFVQSETFILERGRLCWARADRFRRRDR